MSIPKAGTQQITRVNPSPRGIMLRNKQTQGRSRALRELLVQVKPKVTQ